jgi:predicted dehydrogenase
VIGIGVIGCGYWGPNLVRNFNSSRSCRLVAVADRDPTRRELMGGLYPGVGVLADGADLIARPDVDAVAIATPVTTHYPLAKQALEAGKHVLVSKPLARSSSEAEELTALAEKNDAVLLVDHTFLYSGAVRTIRDLVRRGDLGDVYYFDSVRVNLGLFQPDVNVLWDLAAHDLAIMDFVLGAEAAQVSAVGADPLSYSSQGHESIAYVTVRYESGVLAHFHVSWLSPVKVRRTLICGSRRMVVYDHLDPDHQVKLYDKGVELPSLSQRHEALVQYRVGDMRAPKIDQTEALQTECAHFVECCEGRAVPETPGALGVRVVRLLEAAEHSLRHEGRLVPLGSFVPRPL